MIRVIIREVADHRVRQPKSLGILEIEPNTQLPLFPELPGRDYTVRVYATPTAEGRVAVRATLPATEFVPASPWLFILAALRVAFPSTAPLS